MADPTPPPPGEEKPPQPPAIKLPDPDGFADPNQQSAVNRERAKAEQEKARAGRGWRHPKDAIAPREGRKSPGCGSCLLIGIVLALLPVAGVALWLMQVRSELTGGRGYAWVTVASQNVTAAPEAKTAYFGGQVLYEPGETTQEVAFVGGSWWIGGTFHEKVTFRGAQLVIEPGSKFLKGLEVQSLRLQTNGAQIEGELGGWTWRQD